MLVDLHAHYPMHLYPEARTRIGRRVRRSRSIFRLLRQQQAWFRAPLVGLASLFINYRSIISGPRVRMSYMREGDVGVALSVLYSFFDEVDVIDGVVPKRHYIDALIEQMDVVEDNIADHHADVAEVTPNPEKLAAARGAGKTAVVHSVEGGVAPLQRALRAAYGSDDAKLICEGNGMRLPMEHWGRRPGAPAVSSRRDLQHLGLADAPPTMAVRSRPSCARGSRTSRCPPPARRDRDQTTSSRSEDRLPGAARRRLQGPPARPHPRKDFLGWEPQVSLEKGLERTIDEAGVERLVGQRG